MNSGRDPDDLRKRGAFAERCSILGPTRWFRTAPVISLVLVSAIGIVSAPAAAKTSETKPARAVEEAAPARPSRAAQPTLESGESYWVQVGAYRDAQMAKRVAERLRQDTYQVQESVITRPFSGAESAVVSGDATSHVGRERYEVIIARSSRDVAATLTAKGLASQSDGEDTAITPSLSLGEAVALSRDLSESGLAVRVRRVASPATPPASPPGVGRTETLYRVRVGGFPDRAAALAAIKELESRGYKPFLMRGNQ
jgi:cell division septation protein DedD